MTDPDTRTRVLVPIFVGGTGRSGTRVMKDAFDAHPAVHVVPHEIRVLVDPDGAADLATSLSDRWSPYDADLALHRFRAFCRHLEGNKALRNPAMQRVRKRLERRGIRDYRYRHLDLEFVGGAAALSRAVDALAADLSYAKSDATWVGSPALRARVGIFETHPQPKAEVARRVGAMFDQLLAAYAPRTATHWAEDTPYNILRADALLEMFPSARLVHMYRDPRDVVASYIRQRWGGNEPYVAAQRVVDVHARWREIRARLDPDRYREVRLEDLAADPDATLRALGEFAGLDYTGVDTGVVSPALAHSGRWQADLGAPEHRPALDVLEPLVETLGYATPATDSEQRWVADA